MLSFVTNTTDVLSDGSAPTFTKKYSTDVIKNVHRKGTLSMLVASVAVNLVEILGSDFGFKDKIGMILQINQDKKKPFAKVKNAAVSFSKPKTVDDYKDGKLYKTTSFNRETGLPEWMIQYSTKGEDIITEFYSDGKKIKSVQYYKNDTVNNVINFDENGKITRDERYNSDKTLASIMSYEEDKTILESYEHGILRGALITYNSTANRVEISYDDNKQIISAREEGDGYETYFAYENGKRIWSGTYYSTDGPVAYKRVEYDEVGAPKVAYLYSEDRTLYSKTEFKDDYIRVNTKYTKDEQIKSIENINMKTGKVSRQYKKVMYQNF